MQILGCREGRVLHSDPEWKMDVKEARRARIKRKKKKKREDNDKNEAKEIFSSLPKLGR